MLKNVLNLELSSGGFSAGALAGVVARDGSLELSAELAADTGRAASGVRSAMGGACCVVCSRPERRGCPRTTEEVGQQAGSGLLRRKGGTDGEALSAGRVPAGCGP